MLKEIVHQRCVGLCPSQISISIKILGYEDIEENSGCRYQMEQSRGQKLHQNLPLRTRGRHERRKQKFFETKDIFSDFIFRMTL